MFASRLVIQTSVLGFTTRYYQTCIAPFNDALAHVLAEWRSDLGEGPYFQLICRGCRIAELMYPDSQQIVAVIAGVKPPVELS